MESEAQQNEALVSELPAFQLDDILEIFERRKWWLAGGAGLGLLLGLALYFTLPPSYTASTSILVEPQEVPPDYIRSTITVDIERRLDTLRERVESYTKLNELVDIIGEKRLDPDGELTREALMKRIRGNLGVNLGVNQARRATVFEISYSDSDPTVVADVAREIAGLFVSENIKDRAQQASATTQFLDQELERLRKQVSEHEQEMRKFKEERMGSLPSQLDSNLRALDRMNNELAANLENQAAIAQRITVLRAQLQTRSSQTGAPVGSADGVGMQLLQARRELLAAQRIYTDEHPNVLRLKEEITALERLINEGPSEEGSPLVDPALAALQAEYQNSVKEAAMRRQQEEKLREQIIQIDQRVSEAPRLEQEELTLTRDYENLVATYQDLLGKKYEASLARNLEQAQKGERFKVLQPAQVPKSPSWPDWRLLLPCGVGVGLFIAAGLIAFGELRNPSFRTVNRLSRALGIPIVASIPTIDNDRIYEEMPSGDIDPKLVVFTAPESAPAEQYRGFTPLYLEDEARRVVLVTSAARGDGKSLTCMNLALTVACDLNRRVLLIDGDLRRPTAHRLLRTRPQCGLTNILRHEASFAECAFNSKIPNLTVLPAGPPVRNPLALLTDKSFFDLIERARHEYDAVFIDSPPLLPVVDTRLIRKMADLVLFVVRADITPREAVRRSLSELKGASGIVFNQVSPGSFRRYYYYDAYARYAYGEPAGEGTDNEPNASS